MPKIDGAVTHKTRVGGQAAPGFWRSGYTSAQPGLTAEKNRAQPAPAGFVKLLISLEKREMAARRVLLSLIQINRLGLLTFEKRPFGGKTILPQPANRLFGMKPGDWR